MRGFEQPARSALRNYISRKYGSVSALRTAWGDPDIAIEKVDAPTIRNRRRSPAGAFRDPIIERRGIGFLEFSNEEVAGNGLVAIHATTNGPKKLTMPRECSLTDCANGTDLGRATTFTLEMAQGSPRLFRVKE